eukprot:232912-Rhodomonas_salina.1
MITTIVTDSIVSNINDNCLLEQGQEGGRAAHSTKCQIQKLIWAIHRKEELGDRLIIAYIDWQNGYNSVDHEALFQILEGYGFTEPDIRLLRNLYDDSWFDIYTHGGTTAKINMGRGLKQGDALSPVLFLLFINTLLHWMRLEGVRLCTED